MLGAVMLVMQGRLELERDERSSQSGRRVVSVNNVLVPEETTLATV
jgi:hypothetical protein